jgi:hypothetical protein
MNEYCFNLDLDILPFREDIVLDDLPKDPWSLISVSQLNENLLNFLKDKGISISLVSSFYHYGEDLSQIIHVDAPEICDMTKLIWVWGDYHLMNWYMPIAKNNFNPTIDKNSTNPDHGIRNYSVYDRESLDIVYSSKIGFPSLIQVGVPHHIVNFAGPRRSVTMVLHDNNGNTIPMSCAKLIFESYIKVH